MACDSVRFVVSSSPVVVVDESLDPGVDPAAEVV
jgi:hypothetical protein